jgi:hypothetical protein
MTFENEYRLSLRVIRYEYKLVLDLIIWVPYALLLSKKISKLLLIMNPIVDLAKLWEFSFKLFLVHFLIEILAHNLDKFSTSSKYSFSLSIHLFDKLVSIVFIENDSTYT